jgi:hypothetical protein
MPEKLTVAKMPLEDTANIPIQCEIAEVRVTENILTAANLA